MRFNRVLGDIQVTRSSNVPFVAELGAGTWFTKVLLLSRFAVSSLPTAPATPSFPVERMTAGTPLGVSDGAAEQLEPPMPVAVEHTNRLGERLEIPTALIPFGNVKTLNDAPPLNPETVAVTEATA